MRLSQMTAELAGAPLPTTPTGDSLDERIAACFIGSPPASAELKALIDEVKQAGATAAAELVDAKARALDPTTAGEDVAAARRMIDDAGFRRDRMEIAEKRLSEVLATVQRSEQNAERDMRRLVVIKRRDAMANELRERYPALVNELMSLLSRMQEIDAEARALNLPTSEELARHGQVQGNTPAVSLSMARLVDFERQWDAFAWVDGRHVRRIGDAPAPRSEGYGHQNTPGQQMIEVLITRVKLTNPTHGQPMSYFDAFNISHRIEPRETVPEVRVLDGELNKLREYLTVEVLGPGEPHRRPA